MNNYKYKLSGEFIMASYLVTGGAGFIGSNLVAALLQRGERVRVLDNFSTGHRHNLTEFEKRIEVIEGDLRSYHILQEAVRGIDYVLHQGALPSVPRSVRDPLTSDEVNVRGTLNLLHAAQAADVRRLVFASSSSIYGNNPALPKVESMKPSPLSPYATSKLAGENYCLNFYGIHGFETVCLRYFNVFGPRQDPKSQYAAVIPRFIMAILNEEPITIHGDGSQSRDFSFIDNVVQANLLACTAPNAAGHVINVACGERHTLLGMVHSLAEIIGKQPQIDHTEGRAGDVPHSQADILEARRLLGYAPVVRFYEGLEKTVTWFKMKSSSSNGHISSLPLRYLNGVRTLVPAS